MKLKMAKKKKNTTTLDEDDATDASIGAADDSFDNADKKTSKSGKSSVKNKLSKLKEKLNTISADDFNELNALKNFEEIEELSDDDDDDDDDDDRRNDASKNGNAKKSSSFGAGVLIEQMSQKAASINPSSVSRDLEVKIFECEKLYKKYNVKRLSRSRAKKAGRGTVDPVVSVHVRKKDGSEYVGVTRPILNTVDPVWNAGEGESFSFPIFSEQVEEEKERRRMFASLSPKTKKKTSKKENEDNAPQEERKSDDDDEGSWCSKEIVFKIWDLKGPSEIDSKKSLIGTCSVPIELCPLDGHWREITLDVEPAGSPESLRTLEGLNQNAKKKEVKKLMSKKRMEKNKEGGGEGTLKMAFRRPPKLLPALGVNGNWRALQVGEGSEDPLEPWIAGSFAAKHSATSSTYDERRQDQNISFSAKERAIDERLKQSFKSFTPAKRSAMQNERRGRYYVHVMEASNITPMDGWSGSDAYVKIGGDSMPAKERYRTKVKNDTCFPHWNERYLVDLTNNDSALVFTVFDRDFGNADDFCGACGIPLECLPQDGSYRTFNLPLGTRISSRSAGEEVVFEDHERRLDVGYLKVSVAKMMEPLEIQNKILNACGGFGSITLEDSGNLTKYARRCHVRVLAARYLLPVGNTSKDLCDPSVTVQVDNAPKFERFATSVVYDTSTPVWNESLGETFTLLVRPGAKELIVCCVDRNFSGQVEMGRGCVNLLNVEANGDWTSSEVAIYRRDPKDKETMIPSGLVSVEISFSRPPFAEIMEPPIIDADKKMLNVHDPSLYLYVQILRVRNIALPVYRKTTDMRINLTTNTNLIPVKGKVQEDVKPTATFDTEVFSLPMNPMTTSFRVRLLAELKSVYFGIALVKAWKQFRKYLYGKDGADDGGMSFIDEDGDGELDDPDEALTIKAEDFLALKKFYVGGTTIGEFTVDTSGLAIGEMRKTWTKLVPLKNTAVYGFLNKAGKRLGHVEVAYSIGRRSLPPADLENTFGAARPRIGNLSVQIKSVIGGVLNSGNPVKDIHYKQNVLKNAIEKDEGLLGTHISCAVILESFEENFRTAFESATFPVTEIMGEIRIVLFARDPVTTAFTKPVGVACVPISNILKSENYELDVWANVIPTDEDGLSAQDLVDAEREMFMRERNKNTVTKKWQGYCRIVFKFTPVIKKSSWYLRQAPLERPKEKPEDTVIGIIHAISRVVIAILGFPHIIMQSFAWLSLWPLSETFALRMYFAIFHTALCFYLRGDILGAFLPLMCVLGLLFVGYTSRIVEDKDDAPVSCFGVNEDGSEKEILRVRVIDEFAKTKAIEKDIDEEIEDLYEYSRLIKMGKSHKESSKIVGNRAAKRFKADRENAELSGNNPVQKLMNVIKSLSSKSNPMDAVLKIVKKLLAFCINVVKTITKTAISLDQVQAPKILSGPCLAIIVPLNLISQPLERIIGVFDWRDDNLSHYSAILMIFIAIVSSIALKIAFEIQYYIDLYSPVRLWFFVWLLGVVLLIPHVSKACLFPIVVMYENAIQYNISASGIHVPAVCLRSIQEVDRMTKGRVAKLFEGTAEERQKARDELFQERKKKYLVAKAAELKKRKMKATSALRGFSSNPAQFLGILIGRSLTARQELHRSRLEKLFIKNPNQNTLDSSAKKNAKVVGMEEEFIEKPDFMKIADIKVKSKASKGATILLSLPKLIVSNAVAIPRRIILSPMRIYASLEKIVPSKQQVKAKLKKMFAPMSKDEKNVKGVGKVSNPRVLKNGEVITQEVLRKQVAERKAKRKRMKAQAQKK